MCGAAIKPLFDGNLLLCSPRCHDTDAPRRADAAISLTPAASLLRQLFRTHHLPVRQ